MCGDCVIVELCWIVGVCYVCIEVDFFEVGFDVGCDYCGCFMYCVGCVMVLLWIWVEMVVVEYEC